MRVENYSKYFFAVAESKDCQDEHNKGQTKSGVYTVYRTGTPIRVWCDMETDGGGWTVKSLSYLKYIVTDMTKKEI